MIEWVPIKDWKFEKFQLCIIAYSRKTLPGFFALICKESDLQEYNTGDWKVTEIAAVNPPVEKTLEEKFEECYGLYLTEPRRMTEEPVPSLSARLAKVAKEHYEG